MRDTSYHGTIRAAELLMLELELHLLTREYERRSYDPDQPRVPVGEPFGGRWSDWLGGGVLGRRQPAETSKPLLTALAGTLQSVRLVHTDRTYYWLCNYRDMLGRPYGFSLKLDKLCPQVFVSPFQ
jgi:hypothetical protein